MKLLRSVVCLYDEVFKNDSSDVIISQLNENEKLAFDYILDNTELDDAPLSNKLANYLYGSDATSNTYKSFKRDFKRKMKHVVSITISMGSDIQKAEFRLLEDYTGFLKMLYMGIREPAISEGMSLVQKATKRQNYTMARDVCRMVARNYCTFDADSPRRERFVSEYRTLSKLCEIEFESQVLFGELIYSELKGVLSNDDKEFYLNRLRELESDLTLDSYTYAYYRYQINLKFVEGEEFAEQCREAINYFGNLWYNHSSYVMVFRNKLIKHHLKGREYAKAELNLLATLGDLKTYSGRWYANAITLMRVYLKINKTIKARSLYDQITGSNKYRFLDKAHRNLIELIGMFISLAEKDFDSINIRKMKYNLNLEKNNPAKENVSFLVGEIIYLLKSGKLDVEPQLQHLRKLVSGDKRNARCLAFCDYIERGVKYQVEEEAGFESEVLDYEKLVRMV